MQEDEFNKPDIHEQDTETQGYTSTHSQVDEPRRREDAKNPMVQIPPTDESGDMPVETTGGTKE